MFKVIIVSDLGQETSSIFGSGSLILFGCLFLLNLSLSLKPVSCYHCQILLPLVSQNKIFLKIRRIQAWNGESYGYDLRLSRLGVFLIIIAFFFFNHVPFTLGRELAAETSKEMSAGSR